MRNTITALMLLLALEASATGPVILPLWPEGAPTDNGLAPSDEYLREDGKLFNSATAELWVYPAATPNGQAIMLTPGGGYQCLCIDKEGTMLAEWLSGQGITAAVLKYRMPNGLHEVPLQDGRRGIELLRSMASELGFNPCETGVMGGSAGGHFAATLATMYGDSKWRPDFQILFYPVISMNPDDMGHRSSVRRLLGDNPSPELVQRYSLHNRVTDSTPPAFILLAIDDDVVDPRNSYAYAMALQQAGVPYSLHVYPAGWHGFGYLDSMPYKELWKAELLRWLSDLHTTASAK